MSDFFGIFTSKKRQKAAKTRHFMAWSNEPRCAIILGVRRRTSRKTKYPKPDAYGGGCSQDPGYRPESGPGKEPVDTLPVHPFCWLKGKMRAVEETKPTEKGGDENIFLKGGAFLALH